MTELASDDTSEWRAALGGRSDDHTTPEWKHSIDGYVRTLWEFVDDPEAPDLTKPQIVARLGALHAVVEHLLELVDRARTDQIKGPDKRAGGAGEWSFPVGHDRTIHPMGELRSPTIGCDVWNLHHRAYFAAPRVWPGSIVWALAAFKPDRFISNDWRELQDQHIEAADTAAADYIARTDDAVSAVRNRLAPDVGNPTRLRSSFDHGSK